MVAGNDPGGPPATCHHHKFPKKMGPIGSRFDLSIDTRFDVDVDGSRGQPGGVAAHCSWQCFVGAREAPTVRHWFHKASFAAYVGGSVVGERSKRNSNHQRHRCFVDVIFCDFLCPPFSWVFRVEKQSVAILFPPTVVAAQASLRHRSHCVSLCVEVIR